jgi:curved DNA-binding protein CbpA
LYYATRDSSAGFLRDRSTTRYSERLTKSSRDALAREWTPRRTDDVDIATLPLSPADAFVLSQLDGVTALDEIALVTGMEEKTLRATLSRLERIGAVRPENKDGDGSAAARLRDPRREDDELVIEEERVVLAGAGSKRRHAVPPPAPEPRARKAEPREDDDVVDLDESQRQRIDRVFSRLDIVTHYQLLGVERDADKKTIKHAYFALIPSFHPDKFFGRSLGAYKKKLERIFERITEAESVLTRKASRKEYDLYLEARRETHAFDAVLTSIPPPPASSAPRAEDGTPPSPRSTIDAAAATAERNRALARRLKQAASRVASATDTAPGSTPSSKDSRQRADESLKRFLAGRRGPRVETFVKAGVTALESESWVSAVNALRIALNLAPDDSEIRAMYERANLQAGRYLAERYEATAKYEEKNGHWEEAARSWQRVATARPDDAKPLQRAAECWLHTGEPGQGVQAAREAAKLAPDSLDVRLTLARAYEAADMIASALGELGRAMDKSPGNAELRAWRQRLEKH